MIDTIIAIVSLVLAIYFFYKSRRFKELNYAIKSFSIIDSYVSSISGFEALYKGEKLSQLKANKILFFNSGTEKLESTDFPISSPLRVKVSKGVILNGFILNSSQKANRVDVNLSDNTLFITFDYLGKKEGFVVSILHNSEEEKPSVLGIIKDGNGPKEEFLYTREPESRSKMVFNVITYWLLITGVLLADLNFEKLLIYNTEETINFENIDFTDPIILFYLLTSLFTIIIIIIIIFFYDKFKEPFVFQNFRDFNPHDF
jgi:hypothetical protein